ncbi:MAG: antibiotic biosynthesis monooxygenase family protein [Saprospiraceae bacterium]
MRLYKLVVPQDRIDAFTAYSKQVVKPAISEFTSPEGGRFFQASNSPLTFFLVVWWQNSRSALEFDGSPKRNNLVQGVQPFLAERLVHWDMAILDDDYVEEEPVYYDSEVYMRLSKVAISPKRSGNLKSLFEAYTNSVTRKQEGCLSVKLLKCTNVADLYFIFTVWSHRDAFVKFSKADDYQEIRSQTFSMLENRLEIWDLKMLDGSEDVYRIMGGVIEE